MKTRKTLIDPNIAIIFYKRVPIIQISQHPKKARLTNLLQLLVIDDIAVFWRKVPEQ